MIDDGLVDRFPRPDVILAQHLMNFRAGVVGVPVGAQTVEFIKNNPDVKVIGLTATPFTKGLGNVYEGVVSSITTKELVDQKMLVPLRVFIAKEIDMSGAKKVAGEWSQEETSKRGMQV